MSGTILVTGGAGYIGSHVNLMLAERGEPTVVLDNLVYGHREFVQSGHFVHADLSDIDRLREVFRQHDITGVMHFAAYAYVGESVTDPEKYYANNVGATLNLLRAMREHDVRDIIFSSTCATYGNPVALPMAEDHPQQPINPYGRSKLTVEHILDDYSRAYGLRYVSLRYFNAAGADPQGRVGEWHEPETHLIPLVLQAILDPSKPLRIFGDDYDTPDGSCIRDYIHVTDLAQAHLLALDHLRAGGASTVFNLGNGTGYSVKEVVAAAREVTGSDVPFLLDARRPGDPARLVGSAARIRAELGWAPRYGDLHDILATAWNWTQTLKARRTDGLA